MTILLSIVVAVALGSCGNNDDGRIAALEEGLSRAEAREREDRETAAAERSEIAERLSALERSEAERVANEELNSRARSSVMALLNGEPGVSNVAGMGMTDEQMLREAGLERERLL